MVIYNQRFQIGTAALTAACISLYFYIQPILRHQNKATATIVSQTRANPSPAYPADAFPGGRDFETPYGTIKVFEWGPVDGEKVVLMHGIGTPCIALGDMAKHFVARGCRVMLFDFFGRGYSDAPGDLPYDDRLYTTQLLLVLASSPLSWTGNTAFHIVGYSLGGALAASFVAYFPHMIRSVTLVCPGGLVRPSHVGWKSRFMYSEGVMPKWFQQRLVCSRLEPQHGPSADVPVEEDGNVDFDQVQLSSENREARVGDVMKWQLESNAGLVGAYISTIRLCPIYGQHNEVWQRLRRVLAERRDVPLDTRLPGLSGGRVCLVLATRDPIVVAEEWIEDSKDVLSEQGVDIRVLTGGHEIGITKGIEVADVAMDSWGKQCVSASWIMT